MDFNPQWRKTSQLLRPIAAAPGDDLTYDIYPAFPLPSGSIEVGYEALAHQLAPYSQVIVDGYPGVFWENFRTQLDRALHQQGIAPTWVDASTALRTSEEIEALVRPFLGGDDPLFGSRFSGSLNDFYDPERLATLQPDPNAPMSLIYGCGAAFAHWDGLLVYCDVPKNEIQFRFRAGRLTNLGTNRLESNKAAYKRAYFVDWVAANRHKADLLPNIDLIVDEQRPDEPSFTSGEHLRAALAAMAHNYFRVRPWFEPGPWGGQWIKQHIPQLPQDVPNYAWSFELITPENGLLLRSDDRLLEISFDFLMFHDHRAILGECWEAFGYEFPIRFDFLDTFGGGNLSLQCHPRPNYIREHFGERFTQDETYYILDCEPTAHVYLGFADDIDPVAFRAAVETSFHDSVELDVTRYVQRLPAHRHDLFLIPSGTIHCSGIDSLVLEISATPYIFTFKLYDWLRLDLEGQPRPLNIARAFENLNFERRGTHVPQELVSQPHVLSESDGARVLHLPTHREHFYDVQRLEFTGQVDVATEGSSHVLSLVEGARVILETERGLRQEFHFAETFVVPAAAEHYRLVSPEGKAIKVVKAFVKPLTQWTPEVIE